MREDALGGLDLGGHRLHLQPADLDDLPQRRAQIGIGAAAGVSGRRLPRAAPAEDRNVATLLQLDQQWVSGTLAGVIAREPPPQPARRHPHDRIDARIEAGGAAERLDRNRVALEARGFAREPPLDDVAQECRERLRGFEEPATGDPTKCGPDVVGRDLHTQEDDPTLRIC